MRKHALITGSTKGIGYETARQLASRGFHVFISGRNEARLNDVVKQLRRTGLIDVDGLLMDVSNENDIIRAAAEFAGKKIKLDVLINNAAVILPGDSERLMSEENSIINATIQTNSLGPLNVTKAFLPYMNSPARIINISSGGGSMSDPVGGWSPAYCTSKTFLNAITRQLAHELQEKNISVNAVCPGWVRTDLGGSRAPRSVEQGAETPVWLATEASQDLTGKFLRDKHVIPW